MVCDDRVAALRVKRSRPSILLATMKASARSRMVSKVPIVERRGEYTALRAFATAPRWEEV